MINLLKEYDATDPWSVFEHKTHVPMYDDNARFNVKVYSEILFMSPTEYIEAIVESVQGKHLNEDIPQRDLFEYYTKDRIDHTSLNKLKLYLSEGLKMWMPYLHYKKDNFGNTRYQGKDGVHRAIVAQQLGIKKIPVMKITEFG